MLDYDWESSVGLWLCSAAHEVRRTLEQLLLAEGITLRQWEVLACLSTQENFGVDCSQNELAFKMGIEPPTLVGVISRMERDGWLEKRPCGKDRRKNKLFPTAKAEAVWDRAAAICHEVREAAIQGVSEEELEVLRRVCARIHDNLASLLPHPSAKNFGIISDSADAIPTTI